jgi:hypothetical protein
VYDDYTTEDAQWDENNWANVEIFDTLEVESINIDSDEWCDYVFQLYAENPNNYFWTLPEWALWDDLGVALSESVEGGTFSEMDFDMYTGYFDFWIYRGDVEALKDKFTTNG